ncbi:MAG TPA: ATP-binding protein [Candidatus Acidoferrales bacterium]|nr:ATP-binding protein [Candidatus Acidoferrales bacterium]
MRSPFSKLSLLWKILLSTSVAVTVLFAITGQIVLRNMTKTMSDSLEEEVQGSFTAYNSLWKSRAEALSTVSRVISSMSDVRAAFLTRDRATIRDSAGELWSKISNSSAIFLVTDAGGAVIASLGGATPSALPQNLDMVQAAAAHFPKQSAGFLLQNGELYQISVTPVYVQSAPGQELLINVLVAGYHVDALVAQQLKEATNSEFLFLTPSGVIASTLNPRATGRIVDSLARVRGKEKVTDGRVEYALFRTPLSDINDKPVGQICILRSFESAQRRIASLYNNILLLWLSAVSVGLGLTYLLARRIVEPVKLLDRAAEEVARQNYAIAVEVNSQDEIGRLALTFNNMCASIRQAREDLIRQERISTIGRLSSSIVHDLRNPLAAIYGGAEMLVDADLPPAHVKRLAGNIYRASRRIQELLQDLLNVSRVKNHPRELCRLSEVASAAWDSLAATAEAQGVAIEMEVPPEIEVPLERSRMERAFVNLIGNALDAMPDGGEIRITAEVEGGCALVRVEDDGPGIAPEIRTQLFQPFVSAGKRNGLGLGLALSRQTVLEHGGDMWVDSQPGRGARFSFRLPGAQVAQPQGLHV